MNKFSAWINLVSFFFVWLSRIELYLRWTIQKKTTYLQEIRKWSLCSTGLEFWKYENHESVWLFLWCLPDMYIQFIPTLDRESTVFLAKFGEVKSLLLKCLKALHRKCKEIISATNTFQNVYKTSISPWEFLFSKIFLPVVCYRVFEEERKASVCMSNNSW